MLRTSAVIIALVASAAAADDAAKLRDGEAVARNWCAACHAMPGETLTASDAGPSFPAMARSHLDEARFIGALADPHPAMPAPGLSRDQTENVWLWLSRLPQ
jgi:mono/diheme cytochrome c family protein